MGTQHDAIFMTNFNDTVHLIFITRVESRHHEEPAKLYPNKIRIKKLMRLRYKKVEMVEQSVRNVF